MTYLYNSEYRSYTSDMSHNFAVLYKYMAYDVVFQYANQHSSDSRLPTPDTRHYEAMKLWYNLYMLTPIEIWDQWIRYQTVTNLT